MRYFLVVLLFAIIAGILILAPQGLLTPPRFNVGVYGPYLLAYEDLHGSAAHPDSAMARVQAQFASAGIEPSARFTLFFSDRDPFAPDSTHLWAGCAVFPADSAKAAGLKLHFARLDTVHATSAVFPYRGNYSTAIGDWKVHDKLRREAAKRRSQTRELLELHDSKLEQTLYLVPDKPFAPSAWGK